MIATISGTVLEKIGGQVVIDAGGVGYGLYVTPEDHGSLKVGAKVKLYIYEHIRENTHDLFGFSILGTKDLFELLLSVSGVGPKMALAILSVGGVHEVKRAIANGEAKFIQAAPGVGKKVAERVVIDLKDKVGVSGEGAEKLLQAASFAEKDEAAQALVALGYTTSDAVNALNGIDSKLSVEERVKQALKSKI